MALAGRIMQINLNHSARAQDLLLQTMAECGTGLAIVAEPYHIPQRCGVGDTTNTAAIIRAGTTDSPSINVIKKDRGFVMATWGRIAVVSVYASPNANIASFREQLDRIRDSVLPWMKQDVLIAGDFNAKSTLWGSPRTNPRGDTLVEWAAELDLRLLNEESKSTCVRWQGESIVDLTWASPGPGDWRVEDGLESLSDHRYITMKILLGDHWTSRRNNENGSGEKANRLQGTAPDTRWAIKKMDRSRLLTMAQATAWAAQTAEPPETETERMAEGFERRMTAICDAAMPRAKAQGRNNTYWWTSDLESKRQDCARARRGFQHWKRKKTRDSAEGEQRHLRYTAAVAALQRAIKEAKTKAWADLQSTIDRDPWGRPYRIVLAKLRSRAPPDIALMEAVQLEQVLNNLFPRSQEPRTTIRYSLEEKENPAQITPAEMNAVIKKMAAKNTAPGPDGIPGKALALALSVLGEGLREILERCLREGIIPGCWKRSKLVLIPKPGKEGDTTTAYRPICLLSGAGKLLVRILMGRILEHLESAGPNIHQHQYGFRSGRSTVDAISRVKGIAEGAVRRGGIALAVSVDIANAFNTLPWRAIEEGLERHNLPKYIRNTISSYLTGRTTEYVGVGGKEQRTVDRGVPQGSVLGPLLWNIGYDA